MSNTMSNATPHTITNAITHTISHLNPSSPQQNPP